MKPEVDYAAVAKEPTVRLLYGRYRVSVDKAVFRPTTSFQFARGSRNILESAGQKDLQRLWSLSNGAGQILLASFTGTFKK